MKSNKSRIGLALVTLSMFAGSAAHADQALAQSKGCMACHQLEVKVVGPAYKEVAAKYKDNADAATILAGKVRNGGVGDWGQIPMPPQPTLSDDEIGKLVAWIMAM